MKVAIIGGGVIGLSIGWRLAARGAEVTVLERDTAGRGASWAAAGMLAAGCETEPGEAALSRLNAQSLDLWPDFAAELEAASGVTVGLRREGTLLIALNRDDADKLRHDMAFQQRQGIALEWLTPAAAREREPYLSPDLAGAIHSPRDLQVDNRKLSEALAEALRRAGGTLRENMPVEEIVVEAGEARGVIAKGERIEANAVVLATGPWSGGKASGIDLPVAPPPVRPIKGQLLAIQMNAADPLLRHVVWAPHAYLVPRLDGRLIVGATVEERGFDDRITAGGLYALLDGVWRALPGIEELPVIETWTGFRPGSRDDAPMLGPTALPGLHFATGHHRNGILLTPITGEAMTASLLDGSIDPRIAAFGPERFGAGSRQVAGKAA